MNLAAELNNEDTKRKKFQVFRNVSFDSSLNNCSNFRDCLFCYDTKYKAVFMVLKLFYLVILAFKESLFLEISNITEVHFQEWGKYF